MIEVVMLKSVAVMTCLSFLGLMSGPIAITGPDSAMADLESIVYISTPESLCRGNSAYELLKIANPPPFNLLNRIASYLNVEYTKSISDLVSAYGAMPTIPVGGACFSILCVQSEPGTNSTLHIIKVRNVDGKLYGHNKLFNLNPNTYNLFKSLISVKSWDKSCIQFARQLCNHNPIRPRDTEITLILLGLENTRDTYQANGLIEESMYISTLAEYIFFTLNYAQNQLYLNSRTWAQERGLGQELEQQRRRQIEMSQKVLKIIRETNKDEYRWQFFNWFHEILNRTSELLAS